MIFQKADFQIALLNSPWMSFLFLLLLVFLRAFSAVLSILSSHVESSLHVESYFFNFTPTHSLFYLYFYYFILTFFFLSPHFSFLLCFSTPVTHSTIQNPTTTTTPPSCKKQTQHPKSTKIKIKINHSDDPLHHPKPKTHHHVEIGKPKTHHHAKIGKPKTHHHTEISKPKTHHHAEIAQPKFIESKLHQTHFLNPYPSKIKTHQTHL